MISEIFGRVGKYSLQLSESGDSLTFHDSMTESRRSEIACLQ